MTRRLIVTLIIMMIQRIESKLTFIELSVLCAILDIGCEKRAIGREGLLYLQINWLCPSASLREELKEIVHSQVKEERHLSVVIRNLVK